VYPNLFTSYPIKSYRLKNRIIALPVFTAYAHPDGSVSSLLIDHYKQLAASGVSMVVVANASVSPDGVVSGYNLRADRGEFVRGLTALADSIKKQGAVACLQLNHAGRFAKTDRPLLPAPLDSAHLSFNIASLKDFMNFFPLEARFHLTQYFLKMAATWRRPMTVAERKRVIDEFGAAAVRSYQAGFDMIELHGANGYLLCQFLSSFTNRSEFGESLSFNERTLFPLAVIREIKQRLPEDFPIGFRLLLKEWVPGGITLTEALEWAKLLERENIAYLSLAAGTYNSIFSSTAMKTMSKPGYLRDEVKAVSDAVNLPTIISGRIITPDLAHRMITEGVADLIGLGRPLRVDRRWIDKAGRKDEQITVCINCNWCLKRVVLDQGFSCKRWAKPLQERTDLNHKLLTRNYRELWVLADEEDAIHFRRSFPRHLPDCSQMSTEITPTILILQGNPASDIALKVQSGLMRWGKDILDGCGFSGATLSAKQKTITDAPDETVIDEIDAGKHGIIMVFRNPAQPWRERLLYKVRNKVLGFIGASDNWSEILIPVDLSATTLLVLIFLHQTYAAKKGMNLRFVHVLNGPIGAAMHRWQELTRLVGFENPPDLKLIHSEGDIALDLIALIDRDKYGTIIMGKRGISRIKRWLLGSVSAGVLKRLTDQSLFLID